jgi:hypothetical protein
MVFLALSPKLPAERELEFMTDTGTRYFLQIRYLKWKMITRRPLAEDNPSRFKYTPPKDVNERRRLEDQLQYANIDYDIEPDGKLSLLVKNVIVVSTEEDLRKYNISLTPLPLRSAQDAIEMQEE